MPIVMWGNAREWGVWQLGFSGWSRWEWTRPVRAPQFLILRGWMLLYCSSVLASKTLDRNCLPVIIHCPVCRLQSSYMMQRFQDGWLVPLSTTHVIALLVPVLFLDLKIFLCKIVVVKIKWLKQALTFVVWFNRHCRLLFQG